MQTANRQGTMMLKIIFVSALLLCLNLSATAIDGDKITLNGYTSFEFEKQLDDEGKGFGDPNFSFDADLFDLVFNIQVDDRIRAATDITWEHGAASEDDRGNVALEYGFVEYTVNDLLKLRFGKMFTPFGIFNEIHTAKPAFLSVKEAAGTNKTERIVKDAYRFFPRWGTGIGLHGDGLLGDGYVDYDILIANGEQEETNPFEEDNNKAKSITARVGYDPSPSIHFGNSLYFDALSGPEYDYIVSEGIEIEYDREALRVVAEVVLGFRKPDDAAVVKQLGWFVQPSYEVSAGVTPYLRLDYVDSDLSSGKNHGMGVVLGFNFETSGGLIVKVEENYLKGADNSAGLSTLPGRDYHEIKAAVVLGF